MKKIALATVLLSTVICAAVALAAQSGPGVTATNVQVRADPADGFTSEQRNVVGRLKADNLPGSVKHLYVIAPKTGQVLIYSTVRGKVTSAGRRLNPGNTIVSYSCGKDSTCNEGTATMIGGVSKLTTEILQDDGAYGTSVPYIYWWDASGRYHQHFFTDGQVIQISDQPLPVANVVLNFEQN